MHPPKWPWTLRQVFIGSYLMGMVPFIVGVALLVTDRLQTYLENDLTAQWQIVVERLASDARLAIDQGISDNSQSILDAIAQYPDVIGVRIVSMTGTTVAASGTQLPLSDSPIQPLSNVTRFIPQSSWLMLRTDIYSSNPGVRDSFGHRSAQASVNSSPPAKVGEIILTLSKKRLATNIARINEYILAVLIIGIVVVSLLLGWLIRVLTHPIKSLADRMNDPETVAQFRPVAVYGVPEARDIAIAFNQLMSKMKEAHVELLEINGQNEQLNRSLTQTVHEQVAELQAQNAQLEMARRAAQAASDAKSEFIAHISHEVRTPLHGIVGPLSMLAKTELSDRQQTYTVMIRENTDRLLREMNGILDFSKLEAHKLGLKERPCNIKPLLERTVRQFEQRAHDKKLKLVLTLEPSRSLWVRADSQQIEKILAILIDNAIKFTAQGQVNIKASYQNHQEEWIYLQLIVEDSGVGIPKDQQERIFEPFTQADASTTRRYSGSGLGLTIARQLVKLMHGRIILESQYGHGSRFRVVLPLVRCSPTADPITVPQMVRARALPQDEPVSERPKVKSTRRGNGRVLVVDDEQQSRLYAQFVLMELSAEVVTVGSGEDAIAACNDQAFDLILIDVRMPNMDGLEATRRIRQQRTGLNSRTPIIGLTADVLNLDQQDWLAAGMSACYQKPLEIDVLIEIFMQWGIGSGAKGASLSAFLRRKYHER